MNPNKIIIIAILLTLTLALTACDTIASIKSKCKGSDTGLILDDMSASVHVGEIVKFGNYSWRVLEVRDGKALLLTDKIVDSSIYDLEPAGGVTWETSFLRNYLNGVYLQNFTEEEQAQIAETTISNPDNLWYGTPGGDDTRDKLFLLSLEEADRYFGNSGDYLNERRISWNSKGKAVENDKGSYFSNVYDKKRAALIGNVGTWWWLRSPGETSGSAATVNLGGSVGVSGRDVDASHPEMGGVRIALWLNP